MSAAETAIGAVVIMDKSGRNLMDKLPAEYIASSLAVGIRGYCGSVEAFT
jgi:hypothetical protein